MSLADEGLYPPGKAPKKNTGLPPIPEENGFKKASEVTISEVEKTDQRRFSGLLRLLDVAVQTASNKDVFPVGWGINVEVEVEGFRILVSSQPPPKPPYVPNQPRPEAKPFNVAGAEALAAENPDKIKMSHDGGKIQLFSDKHPGDEIVGKFKALGLKWNGTTKKWEQP